MCKEELKKEIVEYFKTCKEIPNDEVLSEKLGVNINDLNSTLISFPSVLVSCFVFVAIVIVSFVLDLTSSPTPLD